MSRLRSLAVAALLALAVAACSDGDLLPDDILTASPLPGETPTAGEAPGADGPTEPPADDATTGDDTADGGGDQGTDGDTGTDAATDDDGDQGGDVGQALSDLVDDGPIGANAAAYLRGDRPRVVLEIDTQDGVSLSDGVIDHVRSILARESNASVEVATGAATSTERDTWTADQLRAAADESRSVAHGDDVAVMHLLVLRGGFEQDSALGVAFESSTAAVFPDQWSDLTTALLSGDRIARAVTTHEVGHLLGLVGFYEAPTSDHEDPDHPGHTTDSNDVMYYAVERDIIGQLDGIPTDFGPQTRADLAAIREG